MQVNRYRFIKWMVLFGLFFIAASCVEKYWPELNEGNEEILVVDGRISNFPGPYTVKLSTSSSLQDSLFIPKSSATVTILDDHGNQEVLTETSPGIYQTKPDGMQGIIGNSYKIKINLLDGSSYESDFEALLDPADIEKVYYEKEIHYAQNNLETNQEGYQFYVNSQPTGSSKTFFFWEIEETYEYHSSYRIYFMYNGKNNNSLYYDLPIRKMSNVDTLFYCWKTQLHSERLISEAETINPNSSNTFSIHFLPFSDERVRYGYNILVKQYRISKNAHDFLRDLKKQNENQGTLFTTQPFQLRGNVFNVQKPLDHTLGYFIVASGTIGERIQTPALLGIHYQKPICFSDSSVDNNRFRILNYMEGNDPIFFSYFEIDGAQTLLMAYIGVNCINCTSHGGVTKRPEFWELQNN